MKSKLNMTKSIILLTISVAIVLFGVIFVKAPSTIVLMTAGAVAMTLSVIWGIKWDDIQNDLIDNLRSMLLSILILLAVGMLVGIWILSGTVPVMVYYGLKVLSPSIFLFATALICSVMSVMTGTSWGTISTAGIALMGVSAGLGIPLHYTAGAIVVGAIFGDKLSPLSDTTVLASAVAEVDIVDHIKHMLYTTIPGFVISLIMYLIIGLNYRGGAVNGEVYNTIMTTLEQKFNLNPIMFIPPVVVLYLIYKRKPTLPVFGIGILLGAVLAMVFQGSNFITVANALNKGFTTSTGVKIVDSMLIRGGLTSMLGTVALLIAAAVFGSPLRTSGVIQNILNGIQNVAKQGKTIMASSLLLHAFLFMITGSYYVTFSVLGPMVKPLFDKYGLHGKNLSRTLEDTGTAFAPIVPWSVTGAFIATTLNIPTAQYILYAPMTYLGIVFALFYIFTGIGIAKADNVITINAKEETA
jgi:Na+:H+ antiporter, NhaC family